MAPKKDSPIYQLIELVSNALNGSLEREKELAKRFDTLIEANRAQTEATKKLMDAFQDLTGGIDDLPHIDDVEKLLSIYPEHVRNTDKFMLEVNKELDINNEGGLKNRVNDVSGAIMGEDGLRNRLQRAELAIINAFGNWKIILITALGLGLSIGTSIGLVVANTKLGSLIKAIIP